MNFFRCQSCEHVFADGDGATVKDHMGVTDPFPVYVSFHACPECGCIDLDDFVPCDTDDCEHEALAGHDYCATCQAAIEAEEAGCGDGCEIAEHQGYRNCRATGQCQNEPRHAPVSRSSSRSIEGESLPGRDGHGAALLLMLAITLACVLLGD